MLLKNLLGFLELLLIVRVTIGQNILMNLMRFLGNGQEELNMENMDNEQTLLKNYDFIIVGAGTAGCTLAARLSENPEWKVLLLEAGGPETLVMDVPILAHFLQLTDINWNYKTEPAQGYCLGMRGGRCNWPRGKVMGGSSVLNYMMYTRGNPKDYDRWSELGNEGWSFKEVEQYFRKYEGSVVKDMDENAMGKEGPVKISYAPWRSRIVEAFVKASEEDGLDYRDYNGRKQNGVSYLQSTTYQGLRWSSNRAYLHPLKGRRKNLHIRKRAMVLKILIDDKEMKAKGVLFSWNGKSFRVMANKEVIVSAGAINSPQLLMLSGLGPVKHLKEKGIKPLRDLAVGYNLMDHIAPGLVFHANVSGVSIENFFEVKNLNTYLVKREGSFSVPGAVEGISFYDFEEKPEEQDGWPEIELFLVSGSLHHNPATLKAFGLKPDLFDHVFVKGEQGNPHGFMIFPMILKPKSRGRLLLRDNNPLHYPLIYPNYFGHPDDLRTIVKGILKVIEVSERPSMQKIGAKVYTQVIPGCKKYPFGSWKYWECYARYFTFTIYHYSGTAKMGPKEDPTAVVDARLRVYGVKNLRVVDASIMPEIMAGHPNGPVFMIAEKAADMVKQDHGFIP